MTTQEQSNELKKKLLAVAAKVKDVKKSGWNDYQNYHYITEKDLNEAVKPLLIENYIHLSWSVKDVQVFKDGGFVLVNVEYTFTDTDTGESLTVLSSGTGVDSGDKSLYKALSGSHKYFLQKMFMISGEDDPERDTKVDKNADKQKSSKSKSSGFGTSTKKSSEGFNSKKPSSGFSNGSGFSSDSSDSSGVVPATPPEEEEIEF